MGPGRSAVKSTSWNLVVMAVHTPISEIKRLPFSSSFQILIEFRRGIDYVRGTLNWGPLSFLNAFYKTFGWWTQRRTDYGEGFHTYVLEWDSSFL